MFDSDLPPSPRRVDLRNPFQVCSCYRNDHGRLHDLSLDANLGSNEESNASDTTLDVTSSIDIVRGIQSICGTRNQIEPNTNKYANVRSSSRLRAFLPFDLRV